MHNEKKYSETVYLALIIGYVLIIGVKIAEFKKKNSDSTLRTIV